MAKPKVLPTPEGREIVLKSRQAKLTNLNNKPEAYGKDLLPRVDLSIEFLLSDDDADQILDVEGGAKVLWNEEGEPILRELGGPIPLDLKAQGAGTIGALRGAGAKIGVMMLKKVFVSLNLKGEIVVAAQLRFDPTAHAELLLKLQCARTMKFSFAGAKLVNAGPDEEEQAEGNDGQNKLPL